ncbi:MAG: hypothetical protein Ct9H300mP23_09890 [Nitrospinota bacterium]|nr:MAG: hypothetical protein Ct9H300mP23_09890 [Nitrospinota bacterium]
MSRGRILCLTISSVFRAEPSVEFLFFIFVCHRGAIREAHPHCFECRGHGVGGIHTAAKTQIQGKLFFNFDELISIMVPAPYDPPPQKH